MTDLTLPPDFGLGQDRTGKRLLTQCRNVDEEFLPALVALAHEGIPRLQSKIDYQAPDIIGREFWDRLEAWPCSLAGQVLARLVFRNLLPLRFASCPYCTKKRYRRL
jgi:hypothetical protein